MTSPQPIEPDTKDWTWVLTRPCAECGYDATAVGRDELGAVVRSNAAAWAGLLAAPDVRERPRPDVWSVLEYGAHVRDVDRIFAERVRLMLAEDEPRFPNWDQDATAIAERYDLQDPATVGGELAAAAEDVAALYDGVPDEAWERRGLRGNGSEFTIDTLGRYHLHDLVHHLHDVRR